MRNIIAALVQLSLISKSFTHSMTVSMKTFIALAALLVSVAALPEALPFEKIC
jgi:hypothetical protein